MVARIHVHYQRTRPGRRLSGFTFLELAFVLTIIGIIAGAIMVGKSMIAAAQIQGVISEFKQYKQAVGLFKDKYHYLPGDMPNATNFWGQKSTPCGQQTVSDVREIATCDGDGSGVVGDFNFNEYEHMSFWTHLADAGFIGGAGSYTSQIPSSNTGAYRDATAGINAPASILPGATWGADHTRSAYMQDQFNNWAGLYWNTNVPAGGMFHLGAGGRISNLAQGAALTPQQAYDIDSKIDDGMPGTGNVQVPGASAYPGGAGGGVWAISCAALNSGNGTTATYLITNAPSIQCSMLFYGAF